MKEFIYKVNLNEINQRLDTYVASLNPVLSRSMAQRLIKEEKVTVNERQEKESYKVKENDEVKIIIEEPKKKTSNTKSNTAKKTTKTSNKKANTKTTKNTKSSGAKKGTSKKNTGKKKENK